MGARRWGMSSPYRRASAHSALGQRSSRALGSSVTRWPTSRERLAWSTCMCSVSICRDVRRPGVPRGLLPEKVLGVLRPRPAQERHAHVDAVAAARPAAAAAAPRCRRHLPWRCTAAPGNARVDDSQGERPAACVRALAYVCIALAFISKNRGGSTGGRQDASWLLWAPLAATPPSRLWVLPDLSLREARAL